MQPGHTCSEYCEQPVHTGPRCVTLAVNCQ
ncbi:Uncharacterised protein [Bordetella pertussis]|nr:Uncharacterised protein [Bordetella pertussis]